MKEIFKNKKKVGHNFFFGFMIAETIIATAIILLSIIGPISAARTGLSVASDTRDYSQSIYLAEEAMEIVREIRDRNVFAGSNWLNSFGSCSSADCGVDIYNDTVNNLSGVVACDGSNQYCELATKAPSGGSCSANFNGIYSHNLSLFSGCYVYTGIKRKVRVQELISDVEAKVTVTITRSRLGMPSASYVFEGYLFNWKHQPNG